MKKLTDETLMFYVDGALDPAERQKVEKLLDRNPDARARLQVIRATGNVLAELMRDHSAPVAKSLVHRILPEEGEPVTAAPQIGNHRMDRSRKSLRARKNFVPLGAGLVAATALIAGIGVGWFTHSCGSVRAAVAGDPIQVSDLVQVESNRMLAKTHLRTALETVHSSVDAHEVNLGSATAKINVQMTFRNEARQYCREYEVEGASPMQYGGIACRDEAGEWAVLVHSVIATSHPPRAIVPAGGRSNAMDAVAVSLMDGDPLAVAEEAAAIATSWKN